MSKLISSFLWFSFFFFSQLDTTYGQADHIGEWKIETVIFEGDTLYQFESVRQTLDFYNSRMGGWEMSKEDEDYQIKCLRTTLINLRRARLKFTRKKYNQSAVLPCWDYIHFRYVTDGEYEIENNSIRLLKLDGSVQMVLEFDPGVHQLRYTNREYNYQVIYTPFTSEEQE